MFTLYAQSSSSNNVSSTVKQCESIQIGKNIAKTYITNYVKQVYLENNITYLLEDPTDLPEIMVKNMKNALEVDDDWCLDNWEIDFYENHVCEIFVKPDLNSETWFDCNENELNKLYLAIKIADSNTEINFKVSKCMYSFDVKEDLNIEDIHEDICIPLKTPDTNAARYLVI